MAFIAYYNLRTGEKDVSGNGNDGVITVRASAYYPFNGNADDGSINSNNGTVNGATLTTDRFGNEDNAYLFDRSSNNYIAIPQFTIGSDISVFCMIYLTSTAAQTIINNYGGGGSANHWIIETESNNNLRVFIDDGVTGTWYSSSQIIPLNQWCFVGFTYNNTTTNLKIIYNENVKYDNITSKGIVSLDDRDIVIGARADSTSTYNLDGKVDEVLIINQELNDQEVLHLHNVLSTHKLNDPLVTKTDTNGHTIKGFELTGKGDNVSGGGKHWGVFLTLPNLGISSTTTVSYYGKFMLSPETLTQSDFIIGKRWGDGNTISVDSSVLNWRQDDTALATTVNIDRNKIYQYVITYNYDSVTPTDSEWNMYIADANGVILETRSRTGYDGFSASAMWIGYESRFSRQMRGIVSEQMVFDTVLTDAERNRLFKGISLFNNGDLIADNFNEIGVTDNLLAMWQGKGDTRDLSANNLDLSWSGTPTYSELNGREVFDLDSGRYLTRANPYGANQTMITIEVVFRCTDLSTRRSLGYSICGNNLYPRILLNTDGTIKTQYRLDGNTKETAYSGTVVADQIHHYLTTIDVTEGGKSYLDGELIGTNTDTGTIIDGGTNNIMIGYDSNLSNVFVGQILEFRLYKDKKLSETEIKEHAKRALSKPQFKKSGEILTTEFDEKNTIYDFDNSLDNWVIADTNTTLTNEQNKWLRCIQTSGNDICVLSTETFSDWKMIELKWKLVSGSDGGVCFNCTDSNNGYLIRLRHDGVCSAFKRTSGSWSGIGSYSSVPTTYGEFQNIKIFNNNNTFTWYINDTYAGTFTDSAYTSGKLGLRCNNTLQDISYIYVKNSDDVVISKRAKMINTNKVNISGELKEV